MGEGCNRLGDASGPNRRVTATLGAKVAEASLGAASCPMAHEHAAVDAAMADEEVPLGPVVSKQKSKGRLPTGWMWDETRELYVHMTTMEESVDRPFDRCGTFGCLLLDKQLRPRIRTPFCLPPALTLVLTACLACAARACTSSKKSRAANDHGARQLRWSPQILSKSSHMQRPNPLCAAAGEGAGAGGRLRPLPPRQEAEAGGGAAAPRPRPRRAMPKSSTWLPSRPCAGELLGGLGSFW